MRTVIYSKSSCAVLTVLVILLISLVGLHLPLNRSSSNYLVIPKANKSNDSQAIRNVAFIKIHKCGSTTLSNILYRYGIANNLTFLLPRNERLAQFWPNPIRLSGAITNCRKEFNILNVHIKYQGRQHLYRIMPSSTKIIAILRHPAPQLKSGFNYYAIRPEFLTFSKFIEAPALAIRSNPKLFAMKDLLWNGMSFDLGLMNRKVIPWGLTKNEILSNTKYKKYVYEFLTSVEESVDLFLIAEHFDKSMVLLQRFLHWDLEDVAYFSLNKAKDTILLEEFTQSEIDKVINWNFVDYLLYVRILDKFLDKIYSSDYDITKDVAILKLINTRYEDYCIGKAQVDFKLYGENAIIGYTLNTEGKKIEKCKEMATNELAYVKKMRLYMESICNKT